MLKLTFILALVIGISSSHFLGFAEEEDPESVEFIKASSTKLTHNEVTLINKYYVIKTRTPLTDEKSVLVHHEMADQTFEDISAKQIDEFTDRMGKKYQIWRADVKWSSAKGMDFSHGNKFTLKFMTSHCVQWDTNNFKNYILDIDAGPMLGNTISISLDTAELVYYKDDNKSRLVGTIYVKNISPEKKVYVEYSTDKWKTLKRLEANFSPMFNLPYSIPVSSPNEHGVEAWTFYDIINVGKVKEVDMFVYMEANDIDIRDNNFDRNYHLVLKQS